MARDRKRARERRRRENNPGPAPTEPHRSNVPGELDHASGDADQFEAALVAGAGGEAVEADDAFDASSEDFGEDTVIAAEDAEEMAPDRRDRRGAVIAPGEATSGRGGSRFAAFLRASWSELQRVQWPDRRQVGQATGVVVGFVIVAGAFLGAADVVAQKLVDFIL
jgi:preprotein translocase SecE subunit